MCVSYRNMVLAERCALLSAEVLKSQAKYSEAAALLIKMTSEVRIYLFLLLLLRFAHHWIHPLSFSARSLVCDRTLICGVRSYWSRRLTASLICAAPWWGSLPSTWSCQATASAKLDRWDRAFRSEHHLAFSLYPNVRLGQNWYLLSSLKCGSHFHWSDHIAASQISGCKFRFLKRT